jgi:hypothetical protein
MRIHFYLKINLESSIFILIFVSLINQKSIKMKAIFSTLNQARKEIPSEFYGGIVFLTTLSMLFYISMWLFN